MTRPVYELKAELFKTLGHPVRIRVLEVLRAGASNVADIAEAVGVGGSTLSQHLTTLRRSGVVDSHRDGSTVIYQVTVPRVFELLEVGRQILTTSLENDQEVLADLGRMSYEA
ncbi:MAG: metalloregulator ArsR/SmtB family transcription factor [Nitriliruptor sp.]|uniref:ArsR/SmtB family transcription factor n=1 Tax=Nitriliruptor sp. TaxID=2448056 RepID=UPI0034A079E9